jgi:hypothetical protein
MMDGMASPPRLVGCQREHADHSTSPIIRQAMAEERAMTAIMLNHEETYEKPCSGHRNNKSEPVAEAQGDPHNDPQRDKSPCCDRKFKGAASMVRLTVTGEDLCPFACSKPVPWFHQELFPSLCVNRGSARNVGAPRWHPDGVFKCSMGQSHNIAAEAVRASVLTLVRDGKC